MINAREVAWGACGQRRPGNKPPMPAELPAADLAAGRVARIGRWAAVRPRDGGDPVAVSRLCRHQGADLSKGSVDPKGCLVCPWHQSRYDVASGRMVAGPRGFLSYHGPTPGYATVIKAVGRVLPLRVRRLVRRGESWSLG